MEELLNLEFFSQYLSAGHIKIIVFIWSLFKCTFLLVFMVKLIRFLADKIFKKILNKISTLERQQQLITLKTIVLHAIEAIIFVVT